jgi:hypothetical protein
MAQLRIVVDMKQEKGKRTALNLSINAELKRLMKIQCASDNTDVSKVTEILYVKFLEEQKRKSLEHEP